MTWCLSAESLGKTASSGTWSHNITGVIYRFDSEGASADAEYVVKT